MFDPNRPPAPDRFTACRIVLQEVGKPTEERLRAYHSSAIGRPWFGPFAEWCGLFVLWALHESGIALGVTWHLGGGFCREYHLPQVKVPEPGDVAYYDLPYRHHAMVVAVDVDAGTFDSVDGNQLGNKVALRKGLSLKSPTCFYSIAGLLP